MKTIILIVLSVTGIIILFLGTLLLINSLFINSGTFDYIISNILFVFIGIDVVSIIISVFYIFGIVLITTIGTL